jgi:hypothetical protein
MSAGRCAQCGSLYAPAGGRPLCGPCEVEDDHFGAEMAELARRERRQESVDSELREQVECHQPVPVPEPSEPAGRWVDYWVGNSRFGARRCVFVAAAPKRDAWGRPIR